MNVLGSFRSELIKRTFHNPHFWIIILIFIAIAILYYLYSYPAIIFSDIFSYRLWPLWMFEHKYNMHGILFVIPLLYAAICFRWYGTIVTWISCMVVILPYIMNWNHSWITQLINIIFLSVPFLVFGFITLQFRQLEKDKKILAEREAERQTYMSQVFQAQENERQHIANELHDDMVQKLLAIANRTQLLVSEEYGSISLETKKQLEWTRDMVLQISEDTRKLSRDLRPSILDNIGLLPALAWLVNQLERDDGINTKLVINGVDRKLSNEADVLIFRIVQEALNNIRRHAKATKVIVNLEFCPSIINLVVIDNGNGFNVPEKISSLTLKGRLGLAGMQQRVNFLGGTFAIQSELDKGTKISIELKV